MADFLTGIRGTLVPDREGRHGPLPPLLIGLTLVTGLVDAFSYLTLGHVFVANMTGNVVFLGFALAGAPGFSITASLAAVAAFGVGALLGGLRRRPVQRAPRTSLPARHGAAGAVPRGRCPAGRLQQHPHDGQLPLPAHRGPGYLHGNSERGRP